MVTASLATAVLDGLAYRSFTDEKIGRMVLDAISKGFEDLGKNVARLVIYHLCNIHNLTEEQLAQRYDLIEGAIKSSFGYSADYILDHIKQSLVMQYLPSRNGQQLDYEQLIAEIREAQVLDFIRTREGHEHIAFLYSSKRTKNILLSEFLERAATSSKALISVKPVKTSKISNIVYDEFFARTREKSEAIGRMLLWIEKLHKANNSSRETRIAGEDASWFLKNNLEDEFLDAEKKIGKGVQDKISVLCSYDIDGIADKVQLEKIIGFHGYVILDQPFAVYKSP